jgi:hypothetical protein
MKNRELPEVISTAAIQTEDGSTFQMTVFETGRIMMDPISLSAEKRKELSNLDNNYDEGYQARRTARLLQEREAIKTLWDFFINL